MQCHFYSFVCSQISKRISPVSVFIMTKLMMNPQNYDMSVLPQNLYSVLECGRHQTSLEIRKSYKNLSKRYHPDKNPTVDAQLRFQELKGAYDVSC